MLAWLHRWSDPSVIANVAVAIVAIWYTIETQLLRKTALMQLELTRQSASSAILPFVLAGVHKLSLATHLKQEDVKNQLSLWAFRQIDLPGFGTHSVSFNPSQDEIFEVTSTTDQVASHVLCVLFDHRVNGFRISPPFEVIAPRERGFFPIASETLSANDICELISKLYEDRGNYLHEQIRRLAKERESVLFPVFFDLGGRLYAAPRPVYWNANGSASYGKSDLIQPTGYPDLFAPPFRSTEERFGIVSDRKSIRIKKTSKPKP